MKTSFEEYSNWWFVQRMPIDIDYNFYTYVIKFDRFYKIGITNSLFNRFSTFRNHLPLEPELVGFFRFKDSGHYRMESAILNDLIRDNKFNI